MKVDSSLAYTPPSMSVERLKQSIAYKLLFTIGKDSRIANNHEWLNAVILAVRDRMVERWLRSSRAQYSQNGRQIYYLSMEFLIGRTLSNALMSIDLYDELKQALEQMGIKLEDLLEEEDDPGLGNGGLGRLAACFLDSMATLALPGRGYGLRYEYGMFTQQIIDGQQAESPDTWLDYGNSWEFPRNDVRYKVHIGGRLQQEGNKYRWLETEEAIACAYDQIIPGYNTNATNTLRLWSSKASSDINLGKFNQGDYFAAVQDKNICERLSYVLYPDDSTEYGRSLRLSQEYFLVSATMQDILSRHMTQFGSLDGLGDHIAIHLNDTHPVLAIPELMRLLLDEHNFTWQQAWSVVTKVFSYTNHTLMSEALETWPVDMMGKVLPYHLQIIFQINDHFLNEVRSKMIHDPDIYRRVSIIDETQGRKVRMAWLAAIACHKVNGVSALHSELMVKSLFADFALLYPDKFCNKTNGVTPRRWIGVANPGLAQLLDKTVGKNWRTDLSLLSEINEQINYPSFIRAIKEIKQENKERLARYVAQHLDLVINPSSLFDVQIKRIHEYKRQLLNVLHIITRYNRILEKPDGKWVPRVMIFAGKAASAYVNAKQIIRLINDVAKVINNDQRINGLLKVIFIPNYSVSLAQLIIPAADLSEQISLAGTEASGTSNMKFAMNGALTIGTLDGAVIEIKQYVGEENMFIFGNTTEQVNQLRENNYNPRDYYEKDPELHKVLNQIASGYFSPQDPHRYSGLYDSLVNFGDTYQVLADYRSYVDCQSRVDKLYAKPDEWARCAALNIANMGYFSSDRTIKEYADDIWQIKPISL